ncbi:threonine synthase [Bdellovibrionota bacterium FG-1]
MRFVSTRAEAAGVSLHQAIEEGLASDGGLYVPESFPSIARPASYLDCAQLSLVELAQKVLWPFFEQDAVLGEHLELLCKNAFNFPIPLQTLYGKEDTAVLELFHGPTSAFKDVGARFLAECFAIMPTALQGGIRSVYVATSGDTGGAVASAFFEKPNTEVVILFPKDGVSPLQQQQLTCWGKNVRAYAVQGQFDDCQRLVKAAFLARPTGRHLTSANSINIGRLLPQMVYFAWASLAYFGRTGQKPGLVIPSGNVGNALAALWARQMGFPIREVCLSTNANRVVSDYLASGKFEPRASIKTLANAMDVGNPSNLERLIRLPVRAISVSDDEIRQAILRGLEYHGQIFCPHTATAYHARSCLESAHWILVATAHPAKFSDIVEPLIQKTIPMPPQLASLLKRPSHYEEIPAQLDMARLLGL